MRIPRYFLAVTAALALVVLWSSSVTAQGKKKIAILGLEVLDAGAGIDARTTQLANQITEALRARAQESSSPYGLAPHSNKDLLEMKLLSGCNDEADQCMAGIGRELGADILMFGKIQRLTEGYQVTLTVLDVATAAKKAKTAKLENSNAQSGKKVSRWSKRLYNDVTGVPDEGDLVIKANVDSGTVYVEGEVKGPISGGRARIRGLKSGKLEVAIESPSHKRYTVEVEIETGKTTQLDAKLERGILIPDKDDKRDDGESNPGAGWRYASWGLTAAALGSGVGWILTWQSIESANDDADAAVDALSMTDRAMVEGRATVCQDRGNLTSAAFDDLKDACERGESAEKLNNFLMIPMTAVFSAAAVVSIYFGYIGNSSKSSKERRARKSGKSDNVTVQVAPVVTPTYTGGSLVIEF